VQKNQLYYGDNLEVLRQHIKDESVDLIYLDPPFNSRQDYNVLFTKGRFERGNWRSRSDRAASSSNLRYTTGKGTLLACSSRQFPPHNLFVGLGKPGLGFNSQPPSIIEQFVHTLFGNFPVKQLAHTRLRFSQNHLQLLLRILLRVLQDGLV
jgi:hypothetical protein